MCPALICRREAVLVTATLDELIPLYLTACAVEGKTDRTVQSYLRDVAALPHGLPGPRAAAAGRRLRPAARLSLPGLERDRGVITGTQHRRQREMKAFFSWCKRTDYVPDNPFMKVPMVRRDQKVVQPFSKEEIVRLIEAADPSTPVGCCTRAMIFFLLDTGKRSSELVSIRLDDLFFADHRVRVLHGKGKKQRWTAISDAALLYI